MARINLLPWREELRRQQRVEYFTILGMCAAAAALVVIGVHLYYGALVKQQETRNGYLNDQIALLDKKIEEIREIEKEKQSLIDRLSAIEQLQTSRPIIVHLFDEMVTTLPEGVYLTEILQRGDQLTVRGIAQSNARVSSYMRRMDESQWITSPQLDIIQTGNQGGRRIADFVLKAKQTAPKSEEDKEGEE
ncbi:MAG: PilN domain-containing protein [Pseudomonadota bacterium]